MELLIEALKQEFVWGLLIGLLVALFLWKSGYAARRAAGREIKRLENEIRELQKHLNTQLKINASGNETLQEELESLRGQNENLRMLNAGLQHKPGRAEMRKLEVYESALAAMRQQAPGFAPAWENAVIQAEEDMTAAESGLRKLVRRIVPGLGHNPASRTTVIPPEDPPRPS
jgi:hypothetical protein